MFPGIVRTVCTTVVESPMEEKKRIIAHLDAIKEDCNKLIRDVDETFVGDEEEAEE